MASNALPIAMGQRLTVTLQGEKFRLTVRGMEPGHYIIVDVPKINGQPMTYVALTGCTVQFVSDGVFYHFNTHIMLNIQNRVALMLLQYPLTIERQNLRKTKRFKTNFPVTFESLSHPSELETGTLRDLSYQGALITHPRKLKDNEKIVLSSNLIGGGLNRLEAIVHNVRYNPKSERERYVTGLQFVDLSEENQVVLKNFIEYRIGERRKREREPVKL